MANTTAVYARIDTDLKNEAESVLAQLGISPASAIQMLYSQVVLRQGLPFTPQMPQRRPLFAGELSDIELSNEVMKGLESVRMGKGIPAEEVDSILAEELGI